MLDIRPNNSIYINNLNEKIKKDGNVMFLFCIFWLVNNSRDSDFLIIVEFQFHILVGTEQI